MDRFSNKRDFHLLILFFVLEIVILTVCFIIAHIQVNSSNTESLNNVIVSMNNVTNNILNDSFEGEGINSFKYIFNDSLSHISGKKEIQKYYTFSLSDQGVDTDVVKGEKGLNVTGLTSNTAINTVIPEAKSTFMLGDLKIQNDYVHKGLDIAQILSKPLIIEPMDAKDILIYHVHATEGYCATEDDKYNTKNSSIKGEKNNVVEAGNVLQNTIKRHTGINVIHDKTIFQEGLESDISYNNAALRLDEIYADNSNIKLQVDVHRNAAIDGGQKYGPVIEANGVKYSQISFVIGLDFDETTGQHNSAVNPYWEDNFRLCMLVIDKLEEKVPGIVRLVEFRRNPYNQNYAENSLLVEIGFNGNLTSEANATSELLGLVLSDIYG